jgi:uncharacterized protein YdeI (YjbR/CyaY-like superfamily)
MKPVHFQTADEFRDWLKKNHARATELWVAFYKKGSGKPGMNYLEAVDEALCFGWIDGLIKRLDAERYMHRFTPRTPTSIWSNINVKKVERLTAADKMHAAGLAVFASRTEARTGIYSFEAKQAAKLPADFEQRFRANPKAWSFFTAQAAGYQRLAIHRVVSPKNAATRERWLARLIAESAAGKRIDFRASPRKHAE